MKLLRTRNIIPPVAGFFLSVLISLAIAVPPCLVNTTAARADAGIMKWDTIPTPGSVSGSSLTSMPGSYDVLSPGGGEIVDYAVGKSGTVAAVVCMSPPKFGGVPQNVLLVSTNYGLSWTDSYYNELVTQSWATNEIVHIAIAPDNPAAWVMTVADDNTTGPTHVYYTDEAGIHWEDMDLVLTENETIRAIDISPDYSDGLRDIGVVTATGTGAGSFYVHQFEEFWSMEESGHSWFGASSDGRNCRLF